MHTSAIDMIANLIDQVDRQKSGPGHPRAETVKVVATLRYFAHDGIGWRALTASDRFVSGSTLRRWLGRWFANGTLRQIHRDLVLALRSGPAAAAEAIAIVVDSCSVRAKHGGDLVGPNPTDRAKPGPKYHVVTLTDGTPLGAIASKANVNDPMLLPHLLRLAQAVCASIAKLFAPSSSPQALRRCRL